tara:strand:- start:18 stop:359 length:342 start_codon:yes stop_codon:yes gene_type:complete
MKTFSPVLIPLLGIVFAKVNMLRSFLGPHIETMCLIGLIDITKRAFNDLPVKYISILGHFIPLVLISYVRGYKREKMNLSLSIVYLAVIFKEDWDYALTKKQIMLLYTLFYLL